jgi:L-lysine 2,3-aminomutase
VKQVIARLAASGDARNAENDVDSVVRATGRPRSRRRFDDRPLLVFWEMTKACDLACFHCRASAQPTPAPDELSEAEGRALIDELSSLGSPRPILILTGGDCLKRPRPRGPGQPTHRNTAVAGGRGAVGHRRC